MEQVRPASGSPPDSLELRRHRMLRLVARAAAAFAFVLGALALVGWWQRIAVLTSIAASFASLKPNGAVGIMLLAVSLALASERRSSRWKRGGADACAGFAAALAAGTLVQMLWSIDLGLDDVLAQALHAVPDASGSFRMAPVMAVCMLLLSLSHLTVDRRAWGDARLAQFLALSAGVLSGISVVGHLYDVQALYRVQPYSSAAPQAALAYCLLALGTLAARPDRGWSAAINSETTGGRLARRLLPLSVALPLASGWLVLEGAHRWLYGPEFAAMLAVVASGIPLAVLIYRSASILNSVESERREAEGTARNAEERLSRLALIAADAIVTADKDQRILMFNPSATKIFGYSEAEAMGQPLDILIPDRFVAVHRCHVEEFRTAPEVSRNAMRPRDIYGRRKDGSEFPAEASIAKMHQGGGWFFTVILRDVTERRLAERSLARQTQALERSNEELQDFALVASHDLQEPLRKVLAFGGLLRQRAGDSLDEESRHYLERMEYATGRMQRLTASLLDLARVQTQGQPFEATDLSSVVAEVVSDLELRVRETEASIEIDPLPTVVADPSQLHRLFQNLLGNALKFRDPERRPRIHLSAEPLEDGQWRIVVEDNGIGFDEKYADRIFRPFQRLQGSEQLEGSGMGLAICSRIVARHGGEITVRSQPGVGSRFVVTLPKRPDAEESGS